MLLLLLLLQVWESRCCSGWGLDWGLSWGLGSCWGLGGWGLAHNWRGSFPSSLSWVIDAWTPNKP